VSSRGELSPRSRRVARAAGWCAGGVASAWLKTLELAVVQSAELDPARPWVLCFLHGAQLPLLAWPRRPGTTVLVSESKDGEILAGAFDVLGLDVCRGSSSRGGARGLAALVRKARDGGADLAFAVDGPRGPRGRAKPGAVLAAVRTGGQLVPMGAACSRGRALGSWDRFYLPRPFARAAVVLGAPVDARAEGALEALDRAIARATDEARALVGAPQSQA
jgi:hypothetical protein